MLTEMLNINVNMLAKKLLARKFKHIQQSDVRFRKNEDGLVTSHAARQTHDKRMVFW